MSDQQHETEKLYAKPSFVPDRSPNQSPAKSDSKFHPVNEPDLVRFSTSSRKRATKEVSKSELRFAPLTNDIATSKEKSDQIKSKKRTHKKQ